MKMIKYVCKEQSKNNETDGFYALYSRVNSNDRVRMGCGAVYKIKEFATRCGCSIYTLRYYDEIDLLKPTAVNQESGFRYYTEEQVLQFLEIKEFQEIGFSVQEIKEMKCLNDKEIAQCILKKVDHLHHRLKKSFILLGKYIEKTK